MNRLFIIPVNHPQLQEAFNVSVGTATTSRYSLDRTLVIIKLRSGDVNTYDWINGISEFTKDTIELTTSVWQSDQTINAPEES